MQIPLKNSGRVDAAGRATGWRPVVAAVLVLIAAAVAVRVAATRAATSTAGSADTTEAAVSDSAAGPEARFSVTIRRPSGPPRVDTGLKDVHGDLITVSCSTCHAARSTNAGNRSAQDLDEFHSELAFSHGTISCLSCHNPDDYDALKLADGQRVEFSDVMTLCAQCHGPQMRAYEHGAHGGMTGHWDLSRGPRMKNNCVDCHSPHAPQFPSMRPTFKPYDRFLEPTRAKH